MQIFSVPTRKSDLNIAQKESLTISMIISKQKGIK